MINRRGFLGTGAVMLGSIALSPIKLLAGPFLTAASVGDSQLQLGKKDFQALLNTTFAVITETGSLVNLKLIEVQDGPVSLNAEQFTLSFSAPRRPSLVEGMYPIEHISAGRFSLFLQTAGINRAARFYQATFNLLT
jgi:hypothetical protein